MGYGTEPEAAIPPSLQTPTSARDAWRQWASVACVTRHSRARLDFRVTTCPTSASTGPGGVACSCCLANCAGLLGCSQHGPDNVPAQLGAVGPRLASSKAALKPPPLSAWWHREVGQPCTADDDCTTGACDTMINQCVTKGTALAKCWDSRPCADPYVCHKGVGQCYPQLRTLYQPCVTPDGEVGCAAGLFCDSASSKLCLSSANPLVRPSYNCRDDNDCPGAAAGSCHPYIQRCYSVPRCGC